MAQKCAYSHIPNVNSVKRNEDNCKLILWNWVHHNAVPTYTFIIYNSLSTGLGKSSQGRGFMSCIKESSIVFFVLTVWWIMLFPTDVLTFFLFYLCVMERKINHRRHLLDLILVNVICTIIRVPPKAVPYSDQSVRPSVRLSVCPSVCPSVRNTLCPLHI